MIKLCETNGVELRNKAKAFWYASHSKEELSLFDAEKFSKAAILSCLYGATKDLTPRTFGKANSEEEQAQQKSNLEADWQAICNDPVVKDFAEHHNKVFFKISAIIFSEFYKTVNDLLKHYLYSNGKLEQKNFDEEHHKLCLTVQSILARYYPSPEYGKSQKIVNMTFKHMYCLLAFGDDVIVSKYEALFEHCHMPLDSYIITWFKREHLKVSEKPLQGVNYTEIGYTTTYMNLVSSKVSAWSHIDWIDEEDYDESKCEKYPYHFYRDIIRALVLKSKYNNMTALQTEIIIWKLIQNEQAAEAFLFALLESTWEGTEKAKIDNDKNIIRYMSYDDKKAKIFEVLNQA